MSRLRTLLKWTLFAVVLAYVGRHGYRLWQQSDVRTPLTAESALWLLLSAVLYAVSWLPSVWFWRELMRALGGRPNFADAARAYYCGSLGKYVPGKAMVLVLRGSLMNSRGCAGRTAAITAAYETLTMMGTGLLVGLLLAPLPDWVPARNQSWLVPVVVLAVLVALPVIARLLGWAVIKMSPPDLVELNRVSESENPSAESRLAIPTWLVGAGCAAFLVSWAIQGLSLGMTLCAVGEPLRWHDWPLWSGAMALSTSLGFAVLFAPAGLGVREGILLGILTQAGVDAHAAVAVTVLSRFVSFFSDVLVAALCYPTIRGRLDSPGPPSGS
ncbi:MAG TPA: lysylphosphatidylglycerol synthase domain-containing protein [Planctomycetaceae bacterium]|nr:lysylphosphatidylglycerol synthase domain-containing protein [Planctomycetaceae bacterium]